MESEYLKSLLAEHPDVGARYQNKIRSISGLDPFTLKYEDLNRIAECFPPVSNMDIVSYLVLTHSFYTKEQMKAFKSLQAYKYLESGLVSYLGCQVVRDFFVIVGKVKHSLKASLHSLQPLNVWCIAEKSETICTAHCTCMAGNSEVCSHVGAVLFAVEYKLKYFVQSYCTVIVIFLFGVLIYFLNKEYCQTMNFGIKKDHLHSASMRK